MSIANLAIFFCASGIQMLLPQEMQLVQPTQPQDKDHMQQNMHQVHTLFLIILILLTIYFTSEKNKAVSNLYLE